MCRHVDIIQACLDLRDANTPSKFSIFCPLNDVDLRSWYTLMKNWPYEAKESVNVVVKNLRLFRFYIIILSNVDNNQPYQTLHIATRLTMTAVTVTNPPKNKKAQGRGRSNSLPSHVVDYLKQWLMSPEHINHPYPSESEKARIVADTGIEIKRLNNWFVNNRIRFWKPRFEAMQKQLEQQKKRKLSETKEECLSPKATSMPPPKPKVTPRRTASPSQGTKNLIQVISPTSTLLAPRFDQIQLVRQTSSISATVSDDDSDSSNESPKRARKSSEVSVCRSRKRQRKEYGDDRVIPAARALESSPRFKYNSNDVEQWKLACLGSFSSSPKFDDTSLPSLDEAVRLFGYSSVTSQ